MCGICGKLVKPEYNLENLINVGAMNDTLAHRGPDDAGVHDVYPVSLGHRRLSIIDLNTGHQPMFNEDKTITIVFNGEIYNYLELYDELRSRGHQFATRSDTEVIVHLYEEMGPDCVKRLRGMFAFALWDANQQQLTLARDRLGKKPLFYAHTQDGLIFASELKGLLQDQGWDRAINPEAIALYLELGYVPSPFTIYQHVHKLEPAHWLTYREGVVKTARYWDATPTPKIPVANEQALLDELDSRLREAVRIRLMSDVPLGAFLSGGIDSSLIVALMADIMDQPVKTFAIGFEQASHNELPYARLVAEKYQTEHTEFVVQPDATELLPKLVWHLDEPFADASALPTYYVSKLAREHVTVALNGDGGDELFGGYTRLRSEYLAQSSLRFPRAARSMLLNVLSYLPAGGKAAPQARLQRVLARSLLDFKDRYAGYHSQFDAAQRRTVFQPDFLAQLNGGVDEEYVANFIQRLDMSPMDSAFAVELGLYLGQGLLVKMDRMSMANSLEARSPLLDQELVAWAVRLPISYKLRGTTTKYMLRQLARRYVPDSIFKRGKQGFSVPRDEWFRGELRDMAYDTLLSQSARQRGYFQTDKIQKVLDDHQAGQDLGKQIWSLLMLELWHRQFVDQATSVNNQTWVSV